MLTRGDQGLSSSTTHVENIGAFGDSGGNDTSRITVNRALRELQTEGLIERRAGSGSYVRSRSDLTEKIRNG